MRGCTGLSSVQGSIETKEFSKPPFLMIGLLGGQTIALLVVTAAKPTTLGTAKVVKDANSEVLLLCKVSDEIATDVKTLPVVATAVLEDESPQLLLLCTLSSEIAADVDATALVTTEKDDSGVPTTQYLKSSEHFSDYCSI